MTSFSPSSKSRLTGKDLGRFSGQTLFDRLGRAVGEAGCLPRKELYEAWELGRRVRRVARGGRVIDVAGGHGLLAHVMLILDNSSPRAVVVDPAIPPSAATLHAALVKTWPRLSGRVEFLPSTLEAVDIARDDLVVSSHACGALTDAVLARAIDAGASVAVMPCCHDAATCDAGPWAGWMDVALAIDVRRAGRLDAAGYRVWTQTIPGSITPKNRILIGVLTG